MEYLPAQLPFLHSYESIFSPKVDLQLVVILLEIAALPLLCHDVLEGPIAARILKIPIT